MKKIISMILFCMMLSVILAGCAKQPAQPVTMGNPWSDWESLEEAEAAVGFSLGLPVVISQYEAVSFRTMSGELLEVIYRYEESEICVRKQAGEGQDISGDYSEYEIRTETKFDGGTMTSYQTFDTPAVRHLINYQGYSWSLVASNGYWENSSQDFLNEILN